MKFLCDNCKAKYQIADDKVAGKTVRMKCRKCGHQIEVRPNGEATTSAAPLSAPAPAASAPAPSSLGRSGFGPAKPRAPAAPMAAARAVSPARAPAPQPELDSLETTNEDAPAVQADSGAVVSNDEWYVAINGVPVGPIRVPELRRKMATGLINDESLCWQEGQDEWLPVRRVPPLAALLREALPPPPPAPAPRAPAPAPKPVLSRPPSAAVVKPAAPARPTMQSRAPEPMRAPASIAPVQNNVVPLVARGGMEARPVVGAGPQATARVSQPFFSQPPQPQPAPYYEPPPPQQAPAPYYEPAPISVPSPSMPPAAHALPAPMSFGDPFAMPPPSQQPPLSQPMAMPYGTPAPAPMHTPMQSASPFGYAQPLDSSADVAPKKQAAPLWFWPILVFTGLFGLMAAYFLFRNQQPQQPPVVIQIPPPPPTSAGGDPSSTPSSAPDEVPSAAPSASAPSQKVFAPPKTPSNGGGSTTGGPAVTPPQGKAADLTGLLPGQNNGPTSGPSSGGSSGGAAGGGLDQAAVQRVVRDRQPGVRRTCWERGGSDQKSSANVTVSVVVAPGGAVQSASATGDDPVLARCIEGQVRSWSFPAPGATTTVNIPFHFVRQ